MSLSDTEIVPILELLTRSEPSTATSDGVGLEALTTHGQSKWRGLRSIINSRNVVGLGIASKVSRGKRSDDLALTIYVKKKVSLRELRGSQVIPPVLPLELTGSKAIPTDVVAIGQLRLDRVNPALAARTPVQPGYSVGRTDNAGTFGALVTDGTKYYVLSNSHVLANSGNGRRGDPILYPGGVDGGTDPQDRLAKLSKFVKLVIGGEEVNLMDAAIAEILPARLKELRATLAKGVRLEPGINTPRRGMKIVKVGRTTGKTLGEVLDVHFQFKIKYPDHNRQEVGFIKQVFCTRYTEQGDSGALVIDQATGQAVGLHFCGQADAKGRVGSVFSPLGPILEELGVELVTALNGD
jgi:hypothetical protein